MKTLAVSNQKGGVGKTSTTVHLAFDAAEKELSNAVIDLDPQGDTSYTLSGYAAGFTVSVMFTANGPATIREWFAANPVQPGITLIGADNLLANIEKVQLAEASKNFRESMKALAEQGFNLAIIDTAPTLGQGLATALLAADFVLSPIEMEAYSIQGIKKLLTTVRNIRSGVPNVGANPGLQFIGMVPSKVDGRNPRHVQHQQELNAAYPQLMIPTVVGLRSSIADALASGVPVWKIRKTTARTAAKEVRALANYVFKKMEIVK